MQSRILIARYTRATDICSRCSFLGEVSYCSRCTREFQLHRVRRGKICVVSSLHSRHCAPRHSYNAACSLFRLLSRSDYPSPSVIKRIRHLSLSSPRRISRLLSQSLLLQHVMLSTRSHHGDAIRLSPSILTQSPLSLSCNCRFFF